MGGAICAVVSEDAGCRPLLFVVVRVYRLGGEWLMFVLHIGFRGMSGMARFHFVSNENRVRGRQLMLAFISVIRLLVDDGGHCSCLCRS